MLIIPIAMTIMGRNDNGRSRWIALVVVCFAQLMSVVDATIVNVALASIQRSLHISQQAEAVFEAEAA